MQKLPLHPDELRIGLFPQKSGKSWLTVAVVVVILVAAVIIYRHYRNHKQHTDGQDKH